MRGLYATYTTPEFLAQAAREIDHGEGGQILRQAVAEFGGDKKRLQAVAEFTESNLNSGMPRKNCPKGAVSASPGLRLVRYPGVP